jgi:hypothetical protein
VATLSSLGDSISLETAPPVVVQTVPAAGATDVDPSLGELRVTYSKPMQDGSWSWSTWGEETFPEMTGDPRYLPDGRTCVLPVNLEPNKFYATWLNSQKFQNFKDRDGHPAVPYLLTFITGTATSSDQSDDWTRLLNDDQKAVIRWTDRQFRSYFDNRSFDGWSDQEIKSLEAKCLDALNGPRSRDYYLAINTLGALHSTNALPRLRELAFERVDKNNRERWMAVRTLGVLGDKSSIPDLIHLVYHGNPNTRWWAQITLVRLTGQNFGGDWEAWGRWYAESGAQPRFNPEIIQWWQGQAETVEGLRKTMEEYDRRFLEEL